MRSVALLHPSSSRKGMGMLIPIDDIKVGDLLYINALAELLPNSSPIPLEQIRIVVMIVDEDERGTLYLTRGTAYYEGRILYQMTRAQLAELKPKRYTWPKNNLRRS